MPVLRRCRRCFVGVSLIILVVALVAACGRSTESAPATLEPSVEGTTPSPTAGADPRVSPLVSPLSPRPTPTLPPAVNALPEGLNAVAYIRDGNVWVQAFDGSPARQITGGGGSSHPRWSPSRRWLAFLNGPTLAIVDARDGGVHTQIDGVGAFAWSPVLDQLAYTMDEGAARLIVLDLDAGGETALVAAGASAVATIGAISWSPAGRWVAYEWAALEGADGAEYQGIWRVSGSEGVPVEVVASGVPDRGAALVAGWTSDSRHLLYWQGPVLSASALADGVSLYAVLASGGTPAPLAEAVLYREGVVVPNPIDPQRVALVVGAGRGSWTNKQIVVASVTGEVIAISDPEQSALWPAWSPDGVFLAYVGMPDGGDLVGGDTARVGMMQRHIWIAGATGGSLRLLTADPLYRDERPQWSLNGAHLLFARMDAAGAASLWLLTVPGGEPGQLAAVPVEVAADLGPFPDPAEPWFGYYGYVDWGAVYDW